MSHWEDKGWRARLDNLAFESYKRQIDYSSKEKIKSPYIVGDRIAIDSTVFKGRENEFESVLSLIEKSKAILIWGTRRIGKSSFIHYLIKNKIKKNFVPIFIDLSGISSSKTTGEFCKNICEEINLYFSSDLAPEFLKGINMNLPKVPSLEQFNETPVIEFKKYITKISEIFKDQEIIIIFDEFDRIIDMINEGKIDREFPQNIVSFIEKN